MRRSRSARWPAIGTISTAWRWSTADRGRPAPPPGIRMARSRSSATTDAQRQRILDAAEALVRRHGPAKTNVVDVARELGQSHASVYRYFASKADLFDALVERWLERVSQPLERIVRRAGPA